MAAFTTHAIDKFERLGTLFGRNGQGVTSETFLRLIRPADIENLSNSHRDGIGEHLVGARMLVLPSPDAVFVLRDVRDLPGLDAPMTTAAGAASGSVVLAGGVVLGRDERGKGEAHHCWPRRVRCLAHGSCNVRIPRAMVADWPCLYSFCRTESIDSLVQGEHVSTGPIVGQCPKIGIPRR
jgi:hypothetical protein